MVWVEICYASGDTHIGLNRDGVIDFLASFASFHNVLFCNQPTRPTPIPPRIRAPGAGIGCEELRKVGQSIDCVHIKKRAERGE